jgi:hypothetical protein
VLSKPEQVLPAGPWLFRVVPGKYLSLLGHRPFNRNPLRGELLPETQIQQLTSVAAKAPLCVDLDGSLVKSDTLVDSLLVLLRTRPARALALPGRFLHGKAAFKAYVTDSVSLDVARLPYNRPLLKFLQQERAQGRQIYLATGADVRVARRVADHLGVFAGVMG